MAVPIVSFEDQSVRRRGQLFIGLAAVTWSTAGVLQRELSVGTATQLAGRAVFAFLALLAVVAVSNRTRTFDVFRSMGIAGLAVAICTAVASGSFIVALNHANVANVLFMQAAAPIAAALLAWIALGESITRRSWVAMAIAVLGVALMVGGPGSGGLVGVGSSLVMTLAFAIAIVTLLEVVLAPLWVWIAISERPAPTAMVGGAVVVVAVVLQTTQKTRSLVTPHPIAALEAAR